MARVFGHIVFDDDSACEGDCRCCCCCCRCWCCCVLLFCCCCCCCCLCCCWCCFWFCCCCCCWMDGWLDGEAVAGLAVLPAVAQLCIFLFLLRGLFVDPR